MRLGCTEGLSEVVGNRDKLLVIRSGINRLLRDVLLGSALVVPEMYLVGLVQGWVLVGGLGGKEVEMGRKTD